jgi:hypothetical protein
MKVWCARFWLALLLVGISAASEAQAAKQSDSSSSPSSSSSSPKHVRRPAATVGSGLEAGAVANGVYRNKTLALTCKIPAGWVLRTDEMNAREQGSDLVAKDAAGSGAQGSPQRASGEGGRVLLAAFSRPPGAQGEDVNASIVIAAESAASYPGLTEAVQYFGPLTEVAKAQGFVVDEEPYEIAVGAKNLVRSDFHKDVGTRVMRQATMAWLAHGYAISITVIGGTEDDVEELVDGFSFSAK